MSSQEVCGIALSNFEEPIGYALERYAHLSAGKVTFDIKPATKLELTPTKPNSARSITEFNHLGEAVGNLVVIVFAPGAARAMKIPTNLKT